MAVLAALMLSLGTSAQSFRPVLLKEDYRDRSFKDIPGIEHWDRAPKHVGEAEEPLPLYVDNSSTKYFPPVISQIGGSCAQASAVGYLYTYELNVLRQTDASLPENRASYLYCWNMINDGEDKGSWIGDAFSISNVQGVLFESDFPKQFSAVGYKWGSGYDAYLRAMQYGSKELYYIDVLEDGLDALKTVLWNKGEKGHPGGVASFSWLGDNWKFVKYEGPSGTGYNHLLTAWPDDGGHAMTIVGYDDLVECTDPDGNPRKGALIAINSWGDDWGDRGRYYIPYWAFDDKWEKYFPTEFMFMDLQEVENPIVYKVGLECDSRDDLAFELGVSPKSTSTDADFKYHPAIMRHQGGDYPMQGSMMSPTMEVAFLFKGAEKKFTDDDFPNWFLAIHFYKRGKKEAKTVRLTNFEVCDYRKDPSNPVVYRYDMSQAPDGGSLTKGRNLFCLFTKNPPKTSFSPLDWIDAFGEPTTSPIMFRTAKGKYAKLRFLEYDKKAGTMKIRYKYNPDGGPRLK